MEGRDTKHFSTEVWVFTFLCFLKGFITQLFIIIK